jgi:hypothetical protein
VKIVKRQLNGTERIVLKDGASPNDLDAEAKRLRSLFGYDVQPDGKKGRYIATHGFYRGKYVIALEPD